MATKADSERKSEKVKAVIRRLEDIHESREVLIGMLDEANLDLIIIAMGIGSVSIHSDD
jgi:hypothetical protein